MNRMIRTIHSRLGKAFIFSMCAFALLSATLAASASQASKGGSDVGIKGHGFMADNNVINVSTTIDAPGAGSFTGSTNTADPIRHRLPDLFQGARSVAEGRRDPPASSSD